MNEATYFLGEMKRLQGEIQRFRFNLHAFLSASRSVTYFLQKEYDKDPRFKDWYGKKVQELKKDDLMCFFAERRNYQIHEAPVEVSSETSVHLVEVVGVRDSVHVDVIKDGKVISTSESSPETVLETESKPAEVTHRRFFPEFPDDDVITLCEEYVEKLREVLLEAKEILGP